MWTVRYIFLRLWRLWKLNYFFSSAKSENKNSEISIHWIVSRPTWPPSTHLRQPNVRSEYGRYHVNCHYCTLSFCDIHFAETQRSRYVRLPMRTIEQCHCTKTLKQTTQGKWESSLTVNHMASGLPGKTSTSDKILIAPIYMPTMLRKPLKWNRIHGRTVRPTDWTSSFVSLACRQWHLNFDKQINLVRIVHSPILVALREHLDYNWK